MVQYHRTSIISRTYAALPFQGSASGDILTTQLFFPDEPGNARDWIFDETLLMKINTVGDGRFARFDFIV